jgi:hypothetical protein
MIAPPISRDGAQTSSVLSSIVWIKWIGTHKNYDKIDVKEVEHDG